MCANCHVVSIGVQIKHLNVISKACERVGLALHMGGKGYRWYGQWVGDSPIPRQLFATEAEYERVKALTPAQQSEYMTKLVNTPDAYIRRPDAKYDIGIYRVGEQYELMLDEWHGALTTEQRDRLIQAYAIETSITEAQLQGHTVTEHCFDDGTVELRIATGE